MQTKILVWAGTTATRYITSANRKSQSQVHAHHKGQHPHEPGFNPNQPRHVGTDAASALPIGTLLGPPPLIGGFAPGLPLAPAPVPARVRAPIPSGFPGAVFFASLELEADGPELVLFVLPAEADPVPELEPELEPEGADSFARLTFSFSSGPPARVRGREVGCGAGAGAAFALPLSLFLLWVPEAAAFRAAAGALAWTWT